MPTIQANGITLHYEVAGEGPPVLLIMGLSVPGVGWHAQVQPFARRYRTVVFDNRGVGRSSAPPGPYTTAQMAGDATALLDALGIGRAHVVGVSMGGMIAQEIAIERPERVGALVLASTASCPAAEIEAPPRSFGAGGPTALVLALMELTFSPEFAVREGARLMPIFAAASPGGPSLPGLLGQTAAVFAHDTRERLARTAAPTLVLTGSSDRLIPPACSERLAAGVPGATLRTLAGGEHGVNLERPEEWNAVVLDFLAAHDRLVASPAASAPAR